MKAQEHRIHHSQPSLLLVAESVCTRWKLWAPYGSVANTILSSDNEGTSAVEDTTETYSLKWPHPWWWSCPYLLKAETEKEDLAFTSFPKRTFHFQRVYHNQREGRVLTETGTGERSPSEQATED